MNSKFVIGVVVLALFGLGGATYFLTQSKTENTAEATPNPTPTLASTESPVVTQNITIENNLFSPASLTISVGSIVVWTNADDLQHNVVAGDKINGPSSPLLAKGESYAYTFSTPGTYVYKSEPQSEMIGTIIVTE